MCFISYIENDLFNIKKDMYREYIYDIIKCNAQLNIFLMTAVTSGAFQPLGFSILPSDARMLNMPVSGSRLSIFA